MAHRQRLSLIKSVSDSFRMWACTNLFPQRSRLFAAQFLCSSAFLFVEELPCQLSLTCTSDSHTRARATVSVSDCYWGCFHNSRGKTCLCVKTMSEAVNRNLVCYTVTLRPLWMGGWGRSLSPRMWGHSSAHWLGGGLPVEKKSV